MLFRSHYYFAVAIVEQNSNGEYVSNFPKVDANAARDALKKAIALSPTFPDSYSEFAFINLVLGERMDESIELRSEERRVGKECSEPWRLRWS